MAQPGVYRFGLTFKCAIEERFLSSGRFSCLRGKRYLTGTGDIQFPTASVPEYRDGHYRTVFGPSFAHNGIVYANSDHNLGLAVRRLTGARCPEGAPENFHWIMLGKQGHFLRANRSFVHFLQEKFRSYFTEYDWRIQEMLEHHDEPHPKRALRAQACQELIEEGKLDSERWIRSVAYKIKPDEWAKPGKKPRAIGDLGVSASLAGFRLTKLMKDAMSQRIVIGELTIQFVKTPNPELMATIFRELIDPPTKYFVVLFSDDACVAIRVNGVVKRFNMDISSCDASHGVELFRSFIYLFPEHCQEDARTLVRQCQENVTIKSRELKGCLLELKTLTPSLFSGSTITTILNNFANMNIALSIMLHHCTNTEEIIAAAGEVGYVVTLEDCNNWHKLQFLKHSPVLDTTGQIRSLLNLGVFLRFSGVCKGDLPGRGDIIQRAKIFQAALVRGCYTNISFPFLEIFRRNFPFAQRLKEVDSALEYKVVAEETFSLSTEEAFARYDLLDYEVAELHELSARADIGSRILCDASTKILSADYGLSQPSSTALPPG